MRLPHILLVAGVLTVIVVGCQTNSATTHNRFMTALAPSPDESTLWVTRPDVYGARRYADRSYNTRRRPTL